VCAAKAAHHDILAICSVLPVDSSSSWLLLTNARRLPCPVDETAARPCTRMRTTTHWLYAIAAGCFALGVLFAFGLPLVL
jgi:hypothetical protein